MDEVTTGSLLKRVFMFLEDGNWQSADEYCERILDMEPENPRAYLGKLLAEMRAHTLEELGAANRSFENSPNYKKLIRFGDADLTGAVTAHLDAAKENSRTASGKRSKRLVAVLCAACAILAVVFAVYSLNRKPTWEQLIEYREDMSLKERMRFAGKCGFERAEITGGGEDYVLIQYGDWYGGMYEEKLCLYLNDSAENYSAEVKAARREIRNLCGKPAKEDVFESWLAGDFAYEWYDYPGGYIKFTTQTDGDRSGIMIYLYPGARIP